VGQLLSRCKFSHFESLFFSTAAIGEGVRFKVTLLIHHFVCWQLHNIWVWNSRELRYVWRADLLTVLPSFPSSILTTVDLNQVIIIHKAGDDYSRSCADQYAKELTSRNCRVLLGPSGAKDNPYPVFLASVNEPIDFALVLGGDGTALAAARHLAPNGIPILAVNIGGHLGFLTEPAEALKDSQKVWDRLAEDRFAIQRRMMLQAMTFEGNRGNRDPMSDRYLALNEMCIKPASADRMITSFLEMEIDGEVVDQYQGDGLLVATPTGSTCYTMSAGGPIVHPGMDALVITPICPLSISSRPIVLPPGSVVSIWPLALDGWSAGNCHLARTAG
jgi:NAD+ kinase